MKTIFLLGFMSSGKTKTARKLAKKLGLVHLDIDEEIIKQENKSISEIFEQEGEASFRKLETEVLRKLPLENYVISCGGGTPCFFDNMQYMNLHGTTVYLQLSAEKLFSRLSKKKGSRPLIMNLEGDELLEFIGIKLAERKPFYEQAQIVWDSFSDDDALINRLTNH